MNDVVVSLPRGGLYVRTSAGPLQFGVPPETIKDSMALGLDVPTVYIVPHEMFDRRRGVNVSECEFPAYYNFFLLKRRIRLLVDNAEVEQRLRTVFNESLFGPSTPPRDGEFAEDYPAELRPDFRAESDFFRRGPTGDGPRLDVDTLIEFLHFGPERSAKISDRVRVWWDELGYVVEDGGEILAKIPNRIELPERKPLGIHDAHPFQPPAFGVTVLGASHGFDPKGRTTGFLLWVGHRGILVDPPVDTTEALRELGVPAKLVDAVILTHCHADHDSGSFQKLLEESRITLITTPTIVGSFLKKYVALSGLSEDVLRRTFTFLPAKIGAPVRLHGAEFLFFYTLHSIPTVGFEVFYRGKSLAFSADSLYDPERIRGLFLRGVISMERCQDLLDFPWHHTVVLHEAGVPPLHTPVSALAALPEEAKKNLYVVHIAEKDLPKDSGLRSARTGLENTIRVEVEPSVHENATAILEALSAVDLFCNFPLSRAKDFLHAVQRVEAPAGSRIIEKGTIGAEFFVIASGVVAVVVGQNELKTYQAGDYFGETALVLNQPRNADVVAKTDVVLLKFDRHDFFYLLRGTDIPQRMVRLAKMRDLHSWDVFQRNSVLRELTNAQKTMLQSLMEPRSFEPGESLWSEGSPSPGAFLVDEGFVELRGAGDTLAPFGSGVLLGEFDALRNDQLASTTARAQGPLRTFFLPREEMLRFFQENPGSLVSFYGTKWVE